MAKLSAFAAPLWEACEKKDNLRPSLQHVWFKNGYAYASDGHVLVRSALRYHNGVKNVEALESKAIHWTIFKELMRYEFLTAEADGMMSEYIKYPYADIEPDKMPNFDNVIPRPGFTGDGPLGYIGLRPDFLARLSRCFIDSEKAPVRLQFTGLDRAIIVTYDATTCSGEPIDQIGILMPFSVTAPVTDKPNYTDPIFE